MHHGKISSRWLAIYSDLPQLIFPIRPVISSIPSLLQYLVVALLLARLLSFLPCNGLSTYPHLTQTLPQPWFRPVQGFSRSAINQSLRFQRYFSCSFVAPCLIFRTFSSLNDIFPLSPLPSSAFTFFWSMYWTLYTPYILTYRGRIS